MLCALQLIIYYIFRTERIWKFDANCVQALSVEDDIWTPTWDALCI